MTVDDHGVLFATLGLMRAASFAYAVQARIAPRGQDTPAWLAWHTERARKWRVRLRRAIQGLPYDMKGERCPSAELVLRYKAPDTAPGPGATFKAVDCRGCEVPF